MKKSLNRTRKLVILAMLCAMAFVLVSVCRIPVVLFLKYEPKDVIITIGGFILGPVAAAAVSLVVSLLEMVTISDTGIIGAVMNFLSTCSFACVAAAVYKRKRTMQGAVVGLVSGAMLMIGIMLAWNYFITPLYMGVSRSDVAALLLPAFLPFNTLKSCLNTALTLMLYKPLVAALRKATGLLDFQETSAKLTWKPEITMLCVLLLLTCALLYLVLTGVI